LLLVPASAPALAQVASTPSLAQLSATFEQSFARKDFAAAEAAMRKITALQPANVAAKYNLALTIAAQGAAQTNQAQTNQAQTNEAQTNEAAKLIVEAIHAGFSDARRILRDPLLASVRTDDALQSLLQSWASVQAQQRDTLLAKAREDFPSCTHSLSLPELRIELLTSLPEDEAGLLAFELAKVHAFITNHALPTDDELGITAILAAAAEAEPEQASNHAALWSPPWSVVIVPAKEDYDRWLRELLAPEGASATAPAPQRTFTQASVGGLYDHASKRLVAIDAGPSLRHEFAHVLHQRLAERIGQTHPVWLLEGLATLVEDLDPASPNVEDPASWLPATSWRTNAARRMSIAGVLPSQRTLSGMPPQQFSGPRALAHYAGTRSAFLWLHRQGLLRPLLRTFITSKDHGIAIDPTGFAALLHAVSQADPAIASERDLDRTLLAFAKSLLSVPEETRKGSPSLGVTVEMRQGSGLVVVGVPQPLPRANARPTTLREGDIIIRVNHHTTRDIAELLRVLPLASEGLLDLPRPELSVTVRRDDRLVTLAVPVARAQ
jgi:hypothetical protein